MSEQNEQGVWTEVPSPFCGSGTDDLKIRVDGTQVEVVENGCAVNTPLFEYPLGDSQPMVGGNPVSLEKAISRAAELIKNAKLPLLGGASTDVNGMRAMLSLADRSGAVLDSVNFNKARRNLLVLQDSGWLNTTLSEVRNRCDLLLVVGTDLEAVLPRFFERFMWTEEAMFLKDTGARKVVYLGKEPSGQAAETPEGQAPEVIPCSQKDLPEVMSVLRALIKGHLVQAKQVGGIEVSALEALAQQLKGASYGVVTWSTSSLDFDHAELTIQMTCELIKDLNHETRCSGLPLGGREGDLTSYQVSGWQTGYPARISYHQGYPHYDPYLYDTQTLLANGEVDALLWVSSFNASVRPPATPTPTIVIGRAGMSFEREPDVYIPVGTPGIDHSGHSYRMDSAVAIRLVQLRDSGLPRADEVLAAIEQTL